MSSGSQKDAADAGLARSILSIARGADASNQPQTSSEEWWVLKEDNRFGPFDYLEIVRLLQKRKALGSVTQETNSGSVSGASPQSVIHDWDYVWTQRMTEWKRISTLPEFQPQVIKALRKELSEKLGNQVNEVFFRRRFARAPLSSVVLVHDNQKLMRATSVELSAGGMALRLTEGALAIGANVMIHFRPSPDVPAFNAECEVLSRRITNTADPMSPVVYGLKFVNVDDQVTTDIADWAQRKSQMNELVQRELKQSKSLGVAFPPTPAQVPLLPRKVAS